MANDVTILVRAKDEASKVFDTVSGAGKSMGKAVALGAAAGATALAGIGIASAKMAADFDASMGEVRTLLPQISDQAFGSLRQGVLDVSKEMGIATDKAVPALYQAISAGVPQDNVIDFMKVASKAAIGGVTDLETAVDGITSVVNAYGAENVDAKHAADVMFAAVKAGKTDFEQLSKSLFNVIPTASSLGVSFEDVSAQLARLTAQGTPTSVATTEIRAAMVEASRDSTKLGKAISGLTGKSFAELIKSGKSMPEVFNDLRKSMPDNDFRNLFSSVEGLNAVLGVTGPNFEDFNAVLDDAKNSAGSVDAAFTTVSETASFKFKRALNQVKVIMIEFGSKLLPIAVSAVTLFSSALDRVEPVLQAAGDSLQREVAPALQQLGDHIRQDVLPALQEMLPAIQGAIGWLADHKEILAGIGVAIAAVFAAWAVSAAAAAVATVAATLPVIAIGAAVAALAAGVIYVVKHWDELTARFPLLGAVADVVVGAVGGVVSAFRDLTSWVRDRVIPAFGEGVDKFRNDVLPALANIGQAALALGQQLVGPFIFMARQAAEFFTGIWDNLRDFLGSVLGLMVQLVEDQVELIRDAVSVVMALLRGDWEGAWNGVKTLLANAWENILETLGAYLKLLGDAVALALDAVNELFQGLPGRILRAIGDFGTLLWDAGRQLITGLIGGITDKLGDLKNFLGDVTGKIASWKGPLDKDGELLRPAGRAIMDGLIVGLADRQTDLREKLTSVTAMVQQHISQTVALLGSLTGVYGQAAAANTASAQAQFGAGGVGFNVNLGATGSFSDIGIGGAAASVADAYRQAYNGLASRLGGMLTSQQNQLLVDQFAAQGLLKSFDRGGIVPGPAARPQLAVVHGGERVLTPAQQAAGGTTVYQLEAHFHAPVGDRRMAEDMMVQAWRDAVRHGRIRLAGAS